MIIFLRAAKPDGSRVDLRLDEKGHLKVSNGVPGPAITYASTLGLNSQNEGALKIASAGG